MTAPAGAVALNVQDATESRVTVAEVTAREFPPRALAEVSALAIQVIARLWPEGRTTRLPGDGAPRLTALCYLALAFYSPQALLEAAAAARRQKKLTILYVWSIFRHEVASRQFPDGTAHHQEAMSLFAWRSDSIVKQWIRPPWDPPEWPEHVAARRVPASADSMPQGDRGGVDTIDGSGLDDYGRRHLEKIQRAAAAKKRADAARAEEERTRSQPVTRDHCLDQSLREAMQPPQGEC